MSFLFSYSGADLIIMICIRLLIIFAILPIHEFAHGFAARKLGDNTAMMMGRLTLNPLAHIDPIGGLLVLLFGFGWAKPVPVNSLHFKKYSRDMAITAFAGPLSNLICAFIAIFVNRIIYDYSVFSFMSESLYVALNYAYMALYYFATINLSLAIFNLIPIEPLDGSRILRFFLPAKANAWLTDFLRKYHVYVGIAFIVIVYSGLISKPLSWLIDTAYSLFNLAFFWVDFLVGAILR